MEITKNENTYTITPEFPAPKLNILGASLYTLILEKKTGATCGGEVLPHLICKLSLQFNSDEYLGGFLAGELELYLGCHGWHMDEWHPMDGWELLPTIELQQAFIEGLRHLGLMDREMDLDPFDGMLGHAPLEMVEQMYPTLDAVQGGAA